MIYHYAMGIIFMMFYGTYVFKMILLRTAGIEGNLLGKGEKPKKVIFVELFLKTITFAGAIVQLVNIIFFQKIKILTNNVILRSSGILISSVGVLIFIAAVVVMAGNWRAGFDQSQKTELVTSGIYRVSRNPAFVGFDLLYIGFALVFPSSVNVLVTVIAVVLFHLQILGEEEYLTITFGDEYNIYREKTNRYLGGL